MTTGEDLLSKTTQKLTKTYNKHNNHKSVNVYKKKCRKEWQPNNYTAYQVKQKCF